ncbi:hypothetical protein AB1Y20_020150 [Prymnesium parvum]|uniref:Uncharacterized protein n=1 Tax=Prymnesium parvum TaxID=97485 RepID=A0AB34JSS1_PRYPA
MAEASERGKAAFNAGENEEAVRCYTEAIDQEPDKYTHYSNRSAAYAKLGQFKNALLDANKCIDLKPDWFKGHSRRGAAYIGLKSWRAALGAFEEGLKYDPTNANMLAEVARMRKILEGANGSSSSSAPASAAAPRPVASNRFHGVCSLCVLLFTFFYVIPLLGSSTRAYRASFAFSMALLVNSLRTAWPMSMATLRNPAFHQSEEMQALMLCLMIIVSPPLPFAIMPFASTALHNVCHCYMPQLKMLPGFIGRAVVPRAQYLIGEEGGQMVAAFSAVSEVIVCAMSVLVVMAQGLRAAVLAFFYFRYVARRHASNFWTKQTVSALHDKLSGIFHHRWCPAPVGMVFDRLKGLVALAASKVQ